MLPPLLLCLSLCPVGPLPVAQEPLPFPASTALAEEVSPASLAALEGLIQSFVEEGEVVGAELLVLKNGRSILHTAHGQADRESETPMEIGRLFCVRSMTKPVIATALLMLIDEQVLALDDPLAKHLPGFDRDGLRGVTVEHLLQHTGGLPMSLLLGRDLTALDGIQAVAELSAEHGLDFTPGERFAYSDQGTDTLTALLEVASGMPAARFVEERVLAPLGMSASATVLTADHPLRARAISSYVGGRGDWQRFWEPTAPPLFPFFLGSQGLYSTLTDYARFMEFWRQKGRGPDGRLLRPRYARKALEPGPFPVGAPTGFRGLKTDYGYLMQLWTDAEDELVAFGHTGSDGTHAWVFPDQKAVVLYFTQSRGTLTGLRVEEALGELFLGVPFDPQQAAPPFEPYLGYYWEGEGDLYRAIVRDGDDLALEILGQGVVPLSYLGEDRWRFRVNPSIVLDFQRSPDGDVTGYTIGEHAEFRFEPSPELPTVEELARQVAAAHRLDALTTVGPVRFSGTLEVPQLELTGEVGACFAAPDRFRFDVRMTDFERVAFDGTTVRSESTAKALAPLEGTAAELTRLDHVLARLGDWNHWYPRLEVIQRLQREGRDIYLVRAGDTSAPGRTLYVDGESGHVVREDSLIHFEGMGRLGQRVSFGDYRAVGGMSLPFRIETELANPLLGKIRITYDEVELGVELPDGFFQLGD